MTSIGSSESKKSPVDESRKRRLNDLDFIASTEQRDDPLSSVAADVEAHFQAHWSALDAVARQDPAQAVSAGDWRSPLEVFFRSSSPSLEVTRRRSSSRRSRASCSPCTTPEVLRRFDQAISAHFIS
uniref:Uncharacterized protein n=1 Tax=Oryza brachyantha TaxID=4533 RepID=J3L523_ORYBR